MMGNGNAAAPDNIPIKVWKNLGARGIEWFAKHFNEITSSKKMSNERRITLIPIYL
jgi:hypothetical protein